MDIETVWERIVAHAGEVFYTKRGIKYTYHIRNHQVILENTNRNIPYSNFETALTVVNPNIVKFEHLNLQGPSYIYGIITDDRIRKA